MDGEEDMRQYRAHGDDVTVAVAGLGMLVQRCSCSYLKA